MLQKPPKMMDTFLNIRELGISIIQGLAITAGVIFVYQYAVQWGYTKETTRAMVLTMMIFANVSLSLFNRSFVYSIFECMKNNNKLLPIIISITLSLLFAIIYVPSFASFFKLNSLSLPTLGFSIMIAGMSVLWFELYKWIKFRRIR